MGGANQLWRNQLLALAAEESAPSLWPYRKVYFSVVHHPRNPALAASMQFYQGSLRSTERFFSFTSDALIARARRSHDLDVQVWANWYAELYACRRNIRGG